jgi:hypothetical protein
MYVLFGIKAKFHVEYEIECVIVLWSSHGGGDLLAGLKCLSTMYEHSVKSLNTDK